MILFTFPYAGGHSLAYRFMEPHIGSDITLIQLEPPGRGKRAKEPLLFSMEEITDDLFRQIHSMAQGQEYVLFGHSMGALMAYLVLIKVMEQGVKLPKHLILSGKESPSVKHITANTENPKHNQPKEEFWAYIESLGALPPEIKQHTELMEYVEPIVRADIQALETYVYQKPEQPFSVPVTVLFGLEDAETSIEKLTPWKDETSGPFRMIPFPGGHFFIVDHVTAITNLIKEAAFMN